MLSLSSNNIVNEMSVCGFGQLKNCKLILLCVSLFPFQFFLFCTYRVLYILYMMSSLGSEKARGPREKALPAATHTSQPQKQIQVRNLNHLIKKKLSESTHLWTIGIVRQNTSVHTTTLANKTMVQKLCEDLLGHTEKVFLFSHYRHIVLLMATIGGTCRVT